MAGVDYLKAFSRWMVARTGAVEGKSQFVNVLPDDTTGVATFILEEKSPPPHVLHSSSYIRRPVLSIHTRSTGPVSGDYPDITNARNRAQQCYQACLDLAGQSLLPSSSSTSGENWLFAIPESEPYLYDRDDHDRVVFSFRVGIELQAP